MKKEMTREELVKAVEDAKTAWRDSDLVADDAAYDAYYDARNALRAYDKVNAIELTQMKQYFDYLEILRKSGVTNMFGAAPYLEQEFGLSRDYARTTLKQWMESYRG